MFIPSLFFIIYYPFVIEKFAVVNCTVLYASYYYPLGTLFGAFYYLPIIFSIIFLFYKKRELQDVKKIKMISVLLWGELFISIPVIVAFIIALFKSYGLLNIIESIMCKFAFVFAICLVYFALNNKKVLNE